jgi:hypothetical protein
MGASSGTDVFGQPITAPAEKDGNGDQIGAIIGAVAGVILFLVIAFMVLKSHKKKKSTDATPVTFGSANTPQFQTQTQPPTQPQYMMNPAGQYVTMPKTQ